MELIFFVTQPYLISAEYDHAKIPNLYLGSLSGLAVTTLRNYAYGLNRWLQWCQKQRLDWSKVSGDDVLRYRDTLKGNRRSINSDLDRLVAFYAFATDYGIVSPMDRLLGKRNLLRVRGRVFEKVKPPRSIDQIGQFIRGFGNPRDRLIAELMFLWGLRRCEVLSLQRAILTISPVNDSVKFVVTGKGGSMRELNLDMGMMERLAQYAKSTTGTLIFTNKGRPLHPETVTKAFATNSRRTGIIIHPHLLRHIYACHRIRHLDLETESIGNGVNGSLKALQSELGHRDSSTTERYLHQLDAQVASKNLQEWQHSTQRKIREGVA